MFLNRDNERKPWKSVLRNGILLVFAVGVLAGAASLKGLSNTDNADSSELIVYDAQSAEVGKTQTVISSLMGADSSDSWSKISSPNNNLFLLNQLAAEEATNREELLKQSKEEIEKKLDALKMDIYPDLNFSAYKEAISKTTTTTTTKPTTTTTKKTTKPTTTSKPVTKEETITSGTMTGTPEQIAAWEYMLSKTNEVNSTVKNFVYSVDSFKDPYPLTDYQRTIIEKAVMAESGTEPYIGVVAIAQCLRESAEYEGLDPVTILKKYQWTSTRVTPNEKVKKAVSAVFDHGIRVTETRIMYFYAPHLTSNRGHETLFQFVFQISKVRFFVSKSFGIVY